MREKDRGSTLLPVLGSVLILTVMMSALMSVSARDLMDLNQSKNGTNNLLNMRGALQAAYKQLQTSWQTMTPTGHIVDVATAKTDLTNVSDDVQGWCNRAFVGSSMTATISPTTNNFKDVDNTSSQQYNLYQNYLITIHGQAGKVSQTLTDTVTISGVVDVLNYALYAPGNIMMTGAPEVDGRIAAGNSIFFDPTPWEGNLGSGHATSYVSYEDRPIHFYSLPSGYEPNALPLIGGNAGIAAGNGIYSFTQFTDQSTPTAPSDAYGDGGRVKDKSIIAPSQLNQYVNGTMIATTTVPNLASDYVSNIVSNADATIQADASKINKEGYGQFKKDDGGFPPEGGDFKYPPGQNPYHLISSDDVSGPIYFDGNLVIDSGATLTLSQPLFVTGSLTINGVLNSSATVYVKGKTTITNVPPDTSNTQPSRLELFCDDDIVLTLLSEGDVGPAKAVTTFHAFLASNSNVYLEGMDSFYKIIGGVCGKNLILNATLGANQAQWIPYIKTANASDNTRRLWVAYDNSYVANPLTGTPTVDDLKVQALPLPLVTSP